MQPWELGELIPIIAIVGAFATIIVRTFFRFEERKHQLMFQNKSMGSDSLRTEIDALREEVARLRDTSTQYDISIQHTLEDMQRRLTFLETKQPASTQAATAEEPKQQTVNLGGS